MRRIVGNDEIDKVFPGIIDNLMGQPHTAQVAVAGLQRNGLFVRAHRGRSCQRVVELPHGPVCMQGEIALAGLQCHVLQVEGAARVFAGHVITVRDAEGCTHLSDEARTCSDRAKGLEIRANAPDPAPDPVLHGH